jgi:hypothetical protein
VSSFPHVNKDQLEPQQTDVATLVDLGLVREVVKDEPYDFGDFAFEGNKTGKSRAPSGMSMRGTWRPHEPTVPTPIRKRSRGKLVEIANASEAVQDGRIYINAAFLKAGGSPDEYRAAQMHKREKSVRLAATTLEEPIGSITDREYRKARASNGTRSAVNTTVFVVVRIHYGTALIDPVIRRHDAAIKDRSGRHRHSY